MNLEETKQAILYKKKQNLIKIKKIKEDIKTSKLIKIINYVPIMTCIFYPIISPRTFINASGSMEKGLVFNTIITAISMTIIIYEKEQIKKDTKTIQEIKKENLQKDREIEEIEKEIINLKNRKLSKFIIEPIVKRDTLTSEEELKLEMFDNHGKVRRLTPPKRKEGNQNE